MALVTERSGIDILRDAAEGKIAMPPAAALLGWQALEIRPGHVRVRYEAREAFYNPQGVVQGGFLAASSTTLWGRPRSHSSPKAASPRRWR